MRGTMSDFPLTCASLSIDLGDRRYDILIGAGLLGDAASFEGLTGGSTGVIVSNPTVARLYEIGRAHV